MRKIVSAFVVLLALGTSCRGEPVRYTLWIDARSLDLNDPEIRKMLLDVPSDKIIISVLEGGATLFPARSGLLSQFDNYAGKVDPLPAFIREARSKGKAVLAYMDCLHWAPSGFHNDSKFVEKNLKYFERNIDREFGSPHAGKYASPFNAEVGRILQDVVEEVAQRYPQLNGLVLKLELSAEELLGFSYSSRMSYLQANGVDIWSIRPREFAKEQNQDVRRWLDWRAEKMSMLTRNLAAAFREKVPRGKVAFVGPVNLHAMPGIAERTLNCPDQWVKSGCGNELILEWRLGRQSNLAGYRYFCDLAATSKVDLTVLPVLDEKSAPFDPEELLAETRDQAIARIALRVRSKNDVAWVLDRHTNMLDRVEKVLPHAVLLSMQYDPALNVSLTIELHPAMLEDILDRLRKATRLEITATANRKSPIYQGISTSDKQAWMVMWELASKLDVRWDKTASGYRLNLTDEPESQENKTVAALVAFFVLQFILFIILRSWKKADQRIPG